ncbi:MAG: hypothetical protein V3R87_00255 [Dehalococcoidia bacterium]
MTSEPQIVSEIEGKAASNYGVWTIGITNDPSRRKGEHENPIVWYQWQASTETLARQIEMRFLAKGMKGAAGGGITPNWVYIFI